MAERQMISENQIVGPTEGDNELTPLERSSSNKIPHKNHHHHDDDNHKGSPKNEKNNTHK